MNQPNVKYCMYSHIYLFLYIQDHQDHLDHLDSVDHPDSQELKELLVFPEDREVLDHLDLLDSLDQEEALVCLGVAQKKAFPPTDDVATF